MIVPWNDIEDDRLRRLWADGHSTAEIGRRMSRSKNSVVGRSHRLGLPDRPSPIRRDGQAPRDGRPSRRRVAGPTLPPLASLAPPVEAAAPLTGTPLAEKIAAVLKASRAPAAHVLRSQIGLHNRSASGQRQGARDEPVAIERVRAVAAPAPYQRPGKCQWTDSEAWPWVFCEAPTINSTSYCVVHHRRCFVRTTGPADPRVPHQTPAVARWAAE